MPLRKEVISAVYFFLTLRSGKDMKDLAESSYPLSFDRSALLKITVSCNEHPI